MFVVSFLCGLISKYQGKHMLSPSIRKNIDLHNIIYISFDAYFYLNNRQRKPKVQPRMENPETLETLDTRHGMKVRKTKTLHRKLKDEQQGPQQIKSRV